MPIYATGPFVSAEQEGAGGGGAPELSNGFVDASSSRAAVVAIAGMRNHVDHAADCSPR